VIWSEPGRARPGRPPGADAAAPGTSSSASSCADRCARVPRPLLSPIAGEHDCRVLRTIRAKHDRLPHTLFASRADSSRSRDRGAAVSAPPTLQRSHDDPADSRSGRFKPRLPTATAHRCAPAGCDHLVSVRPPGGIPLKAHPRCGGGAGLGFPAGEPGISRLTLAGPTGRALSTRKNTISQIPPNTATAPIRSVG
jgi:hypothetical protein